MEIWDYSDYRINSLIIKSTDCCNLRCKYCYQSDKNLNRVRHIDIKLLEKSIKDYFEYIEKNSTSLDDYLYIIWHGGEPLICGIDFFERVVELEYKIIRNTNRKIYNAVQTNATLLNEQYIKFFKKNHFGIGISFDGIPEHHDQKRIDQNGKGSSKRILENIDLLKKYELAFTAICVISKQSVGFGKRYYDFFKKIGTLEVDFIPSFYQNSKENLTVEEYYNTLKEIFDSYINDKERRMRIRVFDDILRAMVSTSGEECGSIGCEFAGRCGENLSIALNGDVYPCDCLTSISQFKLGNIIDNGFCEILAENNKKFIDFIKKVNYIPSKCEKCDYFRICKGGCFNRRNRGFSGEELDYCILRLNSAPGGADKILDLRR